MNTKTLTEKVCADEKLNQLNSFEEVTYYRLVACCDAKTGKIDGRTKVLLPKLYPLRLKVVTEQKLENALNALLALELIEYAVAEKEAKTIRMVGWKRIKSKDLTEEQTKAFDAFWAAYPRIDTASKQRALQAFCRVNPDKETLGKMLRAIEEHKRSRQWNDEHGKYIPHPAKWLNGGHWKNDSSVEREKMNKRASGVVSADEFFGNE